MLDSPSKDHRPRVAAERRARMRRKLVESALLVFAEKGVDASVIDDVIAAAGVSRGTFYNYFRTNAELLVAASEELGNEIVHLIETHVHAIPSPAARLLTGLRLYLDVAQRFPLFARFVAQAGARPLSPDNLIYQYLPIHLAEGVKVGEFTNAPVLVLLDVIVGAGVVAVVRLAAGLADEAYLRAVLLTLMRALGLPSERAERLIATPLAPLGLSPDSLFMRSQARFEKNKRSKRRSNEPRLNTANRKT
jgi:AcrR family transcriptional regulator